MRNFRAIFPVVAIVCALATPAHAQTAPGFGVLYAHQQLLTQMNQTQLQSQLLAQQITLQNQQLINRLQMQYAIDQQNALLARLLTENQLRLLLTAPPALAKPPVSAPKERRLDQPIEDKLNR